MEKFNKIKDFSLRTLLFIFGMFVCCYGIAITTRGNLGTSPISCPPYVATFIVPLTFGMTTFIVNALFLLGQVIVLRKEFPPIQVIQLPIAFLTGVFMDISMHYTQFLHSTNYWYNILMVVVGSAVLGLGIAFEVYPNLTYMPGDGLVKVLHEKYKLDFGKLKVTFDVILVFVALLMSYFCLHKIEGVREGTIISALTVGIFADVFLKMMHYKKADEV